MTIVIKFRYLVRLWDACRTINHHSLMIQSLMALVTPKLYQKNHNMKICHANRYIHVHTHAIMYTYMYMDTYMYMYMDTYMCPCTYMDTCICAWTHTCINYVHGQIHYVHVYMYNVMDTYMYNVYVHVHVPQYID